MKFSYLRHHEVIQLANPNEYFYIDTAVGVVDKGLARMGANCYLTPLNSKLDDYTHLEVRWSYWIDSSKKGIKRIYIPMSIPQMFIGHSISIRTPNIIQL